jgi:hypothetical protein
MGVKRDRYASMHTEKMNTKYFHERYILDELTMIDSIDSIERQCHCSAPSRHVIQRAERLLMSYWLVVAASFESTCGQVAWPHALA